MTEPTWHTFGRALLGSWPSQVTNWGEEGITAFIAELQQRGVGRPEAAVVALRMCDDRFPPSAGELAAQARRDPSRPTFEEAFRLIYGVRGVLRARPSATSFPDAASRDRAWHEAALARARTMHPLIARFCEREGVGRLRMLEVDDPTFGEVRRKELRGSWDRLCEASELREVAALASGRRGAVGRFDPLSALRPVPELGEGSDAR